MNTESKCEFLTVQQVADLLQVPVSWVYGRYASVRSKNCPDIASENTGVSTRRRSWCGWRNSVRAERRLDMRTTLRNDAEQAGRAIGTPTKGEPMARRGFQRGSLFRRGTRKKVWVARWWEDVIHTDGTFGRLRRSEVIGTVADYPTRSRAMQVLSQRLGSINSGKTRPQSVRTFGDFAKDDWMPVVLPALKYATQKHYKYMLDVHLVPAFGKRQLRELSREELQSFLSQKLNGGLSWETVHHFKCGLSKILSAAEECGYITENVAQGNETPATAACQRSESNSPTRKPVST